MRFLNCLFILFFREWLDANSKYGADYRETFKLFRNFRKLVLFFRVFLKDFRSKKSDILFCKKTSDQTEKQEHENFRIVPKEAPTQERVAQLTFKN